MNEPVPPAALDWLPLLLQISDTAFPTGAYAHSLGFEQCVTLGLAHNEETLRAHLFEHTLPALAAFDLPYLRFALAAARGPDFDTLCALDAEAGAARLSRETRAASIQLGVRRLKSLSNLLPDDPLLAACEEALQAGRLAGHHVIVCGVQAAAAGLPLEAALGAYAHQTLAGVGGAALKLIRIGQDGVQRALRAAAERVPEGMARSLEVERKEAGWFDPLLEIASMRHEHAGERLFIS